MTRLIQDLRYALRTLARSPGFTALAMLTLALGIGATTAIFSVVNPILFQPLPYAGGDRIMMLWEKDKEGTESNTGYQTFLDVRRMATTLEAVAVMSDWQPTIQSGGESERLTGQRVTQDFFRVLGVHPALGRDFTAEENVRGQHRVTVLSHGLWQRRFGGDPAVIGRPVTFDGIQYTVVGVMSEKFESLLSPRSQLWAPLGYEATLPWACRTCRHLRVVIRTREGVTVEAASREMNLISGRIVAEHPTEYSATGMFVVPLATQLTRSVRPALLAVLGAVGFVLLIACANVSSLLLGRAMQREGEFAIRCALGAGRGRVVRQLLTESVLLSVIGGAIGVGLAFFGVKGLVALGPGALPRLSAVGIDWGVLAFTGGLSVVTGLLFGVVPAVATARPDLFTALKPGGRHTGMRSRRRMRAGLVVGEIALAVMLLVGAGLLLRSLDKLLAVNPGFEAAGVATMEVQTTGAAYDEDPKVRAFFERALAAVRVLPGVESAGWTSMLPLGGNFDRYGVQIEGKLLANPEEAPSADRFAVWPGYLESMRIPLKRGRTITEQDGIKSPPVVLINETFAKLGWPGENPLGKRVQMGGPDQPWREIVGIVGDVRSEGLDLALAPQVYMPAVQWQFADAAMVLAARTRGDPADLLAATRGAIRSVDASLPILLAATMEEVLSATARPRRFVFVLFQVFAVVALLLAAAGIYGVLAGSVTERTREIGIRSALGASRGGLLKLVVRQGLLLTGSGMAVGVAGALVLARFLGGLLFGVGGNDPRTFISVVLLLTAVAAVACWAPAWRATRVSPLEALRGE
jgi:putative ABC transport system permease protein